MRARTPTRTHTHVCMRKEDQEDPVFMKHIRACKQEKEGGRERGGEGMGREGEREGGSQV